MNREILMGFAFEENKGKAKETHSKECNFSNVFWL